MDRVRHGLDEGAEEVSGDASCDLLVQLDKRKLGDAVDRDQEIEPAFCGLDFGNVDVEIAQRVGFEFASDRGGVSIGSQKGPPIGVQKGPPLLCGCAALLCAPEP